MNQNEESAKEKRDRIDYLIHKIENEHCSLNETRESISEMVRLENELSNERTSFFKRVMEIVPRNNTREAYKITHTIPLDNKNEYIELLLDGLSCDAAFEKIKDKYNL